MYDTEGVRKQRWVSLDLEDKRGTKTEANHQLTEVLAQYNVGDLYLQENMTHADRERNQIAEVSLARKNEWLLKKADLLDPLVRKDDLILGIKQS